MIDIQIVCYQTTCIADQIQQISLVELTLVQVMFVTWCQQAIAWNNVDPDQLCHVVSIGQNELIFIFTIWMIFIRGGHTWNNWWPNNIKKMYIYLI